MNRLRWWLVSGAGIPWALRIGARVSSTHPTGQRACRRPANFIVAGHRLLERAAIRVLTADWHPPGHGSFAASHAGRVPFEQGVVGGIEQTLWPVHCVQGSHGAAFHPDLNSDRGDLILRKGFRPQLDSYSAFFENDRITSTGLDGYLRSRGVEAVAIVGLALDYCVAWSAEDAVRLGYRTRVLLQGCRAIDQGGSLRQALASLRQAGVVLDEALEL